LTILISIVSFAGTASAEVIYQELHLVPTLLKAHGLVMSIAFVIIMPLGALLIRTLKFKGGVWVHVACQLLGWVLMLAGLALGVRTGKIIDRVGISFFTFHCRQHFECASH
jgi:hypothetical protein